MYGFQGSALPFVNYCAGDIGSSYDLSSGDHGEHFDAISWFATQELGGEPTGPLSTADLRDFLEHKVDRRHQPIKTLIREYTDDVDGVFSQLRSLRRRIKDIEEDEMDLTIPVKDRITKMIENLRSGKEIPSLQCEFRSSSAVTAALEWTAPKFDPPLDANQLLDFINTGRLDGYSSEVLADKLEVLNNSIKSEAQRLKTNLALPTGRIEKAIEDIIKENMI